MRKLYDVVVDPSGRVAVVVDDVELYDLLDDHFSETIGLDPVYYTHGNYDNALWFAKDVPKERVCEAMSLLDEAYLLRVWKRNHGTCDECGSDFYRRATPYASICAECARQLYALDGCSHVVIEGRCFTCGWDGSRSNYTAKLAGEVP